MLGDLSVAMGVFVRVGSVGVGDGDGNGDGDGVGSWSWCWYWRTWIWSTGMRIGASTSMYASSQD